VLSLDHIRAAPGCFFLLQEFEKSLSQSLFHHVRAGELDQAIQVCDAVDQTWRGAALRGAKAFCWDQLGESRVCTLLTFSLIVPLVKADNPEKENDAMDEDNGTKPSSFYGNPRRRLWRKACQVSAANVSQLGRFAPKTLPLRN